MSERALEVDFQQVVIHLKTWLRTKGVAIKKDLPETTNELQEMWMIGANTTIEKVEEWLKKQGI